MSSPDVGPLTGHLFAIGGEDVTSRHVRRLLRDLGGTVTDRAPADLVIEVEPTPVIADWARSGAMALNCYGDAAPSAQRPGAGSIMRAALIVTAALTELRTGRRPELPDVRLLGERAAIAGLRREPHRSVGGATRTLRAADGWWVLTLARPDDADLVPALVEAGADDPWPAVQRWAAARAAGEAVERAQLLGLAAAVVPGPATADPGRRSAAIRIEPGGPRARRETPRVVDLSALWAGPLCASLLAMTGAEVIKVESPDRLDGARRGPAAFFDLLHGGHRSVLLNLRSPDGRDRLRRLLESADVVIDSSRPRAMHQLGIDPATIVAGGTIWTSITAYGRSGPWADWVGFGDDVAAAAGLVVDLDGVPVPSGDAIADPLAGAHAAAATAAALLGPTGFLLDVSMSGVVRTAADVAGEPCEVVALPDGCWSVRWDGAECPVASPTARPHAEPARPAGADNDLLIASGVGA